MTRSEWANSVAALATGVGVIEFSFISIVPTRVDWNWFESGGLTIISLVAGILGYLEPKHAGRWGFLPIVAIPAWMLIRGGNLGNLWPIFLFAFMAFAIPPMIAAWIGAWLRRRRQAPQ
jgi:hypothetical protein